MFEIIERKAAMNGNLRYDVIHNGFWVCSYDARILADRHAARGF